MTHTPEFLACYPESWYGRYSNIKADLNRCCAKIYHATWASSLQCARKNGHGPHGAYCKQHDPVAVKAKDEARRAKYKAERDKKERVHVFQSDCIAAIRKIAEGHNDPRGLAQDIIAKMEAKA